MTSQTDLLAQLQAVQARLSALEAALSQNVGDLVRGFGRLDETMVAFGARLDAGHGAVTGNLNTLNENIVAFGARMDASLSMLVQAFGRLDAAVVGTGEALAQTADASVRTAWEAKAALSAELKDLPQRLADAGIGGGGLARTNDDVPAGDLLFPHAARADVEPVDLASDMNALGKDIATVAAKATEAVVAKLEGIDFSPMARNSPELKDIDWAPYIECSAIRVAHTLAALEKHVPKGARILDFGAYFGNFSLALAASGYITEAVDAYKGPFGGAMAPFAEMMTEAGVTIHDVADVGYDFGGLKAETYDAVLFMGAIEHVPHTPRLAFEAINRVLKTGGVLALDTPNLGYAYNRRKFASGGTVFPPIEFQFETEAPFFGHHREYLPREVFWMLERVGHEILEKDMFNYSFYGMNELRGEHLALWRLMQEHPQMRELIFTVSRKI